MTLPCPRRSETGFSRTDPEKDSFHGGYCNYCGSMDPDEFMKGLKQDGVVINNVMLIPTDKTYKVYYVETLLGKTKSMKKFYFQHLSEDQKREFVQLLNEKKITVDYPGHFYVSPYFIDK